jgi:hypothetical protein
MANKHSFLVLMSTLAIISCLLLGFSTSAFAKKKLPETTAEGLVLQKHTKLAAVYLKPGATLAGYDKVYMTDVYVAFRKNWQRDYNRDEVGLDGRVSDKDMETMKTRMAKYFKEVFTKVLQEGGYAVVDSAAKDVLLLRPAIINLVVDAPDILRAGMEATFVASAGEMTLYMELYDSLTSDLLAKVVDAEEAGGDGYAMRANRVTNKVEADRVLRHWANILKKHLDSVQATAN